MSLHVEQAIDIDDVEREIASGTRRLAFAPLIEAAFERDSAPRRVGVIVTTGIAAVVLYDVFLAADWVTLHDRFWWMVIARLGIFTPVIVVILLLVGRSPSGFARESLAAIGGIVGVFLPMAVMAFSEGPHRLNYQYGSLLVMMFATVVQRLRFRFAIVGLLCMLAIQLVTTHLSRAFDDETYLGIVLFFATASVLLAFTTYFLEHAERRGFLFALRGELLRAQIEIGARADPLTGLFNRRHLAELTDEIWTAARIEPRIVSAILLDVDHFKMFNDSRGHLQGDECLRIVSTCIAAVAGDRQGLAFRFGGEEMLVLLPGVDAADAIRTADDIRAAIEAQAIPHPAIGGALTASVGVAAVVAPQTSASDLIAAADTALYAAKRAGRNQVWPPAASGAAVVARELAAA